jgi:hypothetical protein
MTLHPWWQTAPSSNIQHSTWYGFKVRLSTIISSITRQAWQPESSCKEYIPQPAMLFGTHVKVLQLLMIPAPAPVPPRRT